MRLPLFRKLGIHQRASIRWQLVSFPCRKRNEPSSVYSNPMQSGFNPIGTRRSPLTLHPTLYQVPDSIGEKRDRQDKKQNTSKHLCFIRLLPSHQPISGFNQKSCLTWNTIFAHFRLSSLQLMVGNEEWCLPFEPPPRRFSAHLFSIVAALALRALFKPCSTPLPSMIDPGRQATEQQTNRNVTPSWRSCRSVNAWYEAGRASENHRQTLFHIASERRLVPGSPSREHAGCDDPKGCNVL